MAVERYDPGWDYLGKGEHAAYVLSFTLGICTWTSCNILSSSRSFWSLLSRFFCLVSYLNLIYENGLFYYRDFMHRLTIRSNFPRLLCLDLHDATFRQTPHPHTHPLEATTPTFRLGGIVGNDQLVHSTGSSTITSCVTTECLKIDVDPGHATHCPIQLLVSTPDNTANGQLLRHILNGLLSIAVVSCNFFVLSDGASGLLCSACRTNLQAKFKLGIISPSKPAHAVIPKSSCRTPSGTQNHNLNSFAESAAGLIILCLCFIPASAAHIAEPAQIPDVVYLIPQSDDGGLHLGKRDLSTHDAQWRAMVIGSTIGSTAGAVILGIGIYLLFRARHRRRTTDLTRSESQPIEMQPTGSRAMPSNSTRAPRSRPPPRAPVQETSGGPSSWMAKTPRTSSLTSLELQPRLFHPRDISHATHIRASTGSQFTEHFEPVLRAQRRLSGGVITEDACQPPGKATQHFHTSADPQGSGEPVEPDIINTSTPEQLREQSERPRSNSQMTTPLPPGAAAPVESVGNYMPPEASNTPNSRIQLS
ncbi:hypothetical protein B0J17DRAFT_708151 [Rhizoctonia solani]|nr:hypothetical protein B0J17DRAFT_708151 [Rhizoctonia solani]